MSEVRQVDWLSVVQKHVIVIIIIKSAKFAETSFPAYVHLYPRPNNIIV